MNGPCSSTGRARRSGGSIGAAAAAALMLGACGPPQQASDSGTLIHVAEDVPVGLDYDGPAAAIPTSQTGVVNLMEPLLAYGRRSRADDGSVGLPDFGRIEGRLAESWHYDPERLTWTFELRRGVVGCSGNVFTADDVVYTFARAKAVAGAIPVGWFLASTASIEGFDASVFADPAARVLGDEVIKRDDYTVEIRQAAPNPLFLHVLTAFGLHVFDSRSALEHRSEDDPWSSRYVNNEVAPGFGPYCLERWTKNNEFVLSANENYYRGRPAVKRVVIKRIPQSANRFILGRMGDAGLVEKLTPREFGALREAPDVHVSGVTGNENLFVHMNFMTPPFDDTVVRRAVAHAIPYEAIAEGAYIGQARRWRGVVPSAYPDYFDGGIRYDYDPAEVRRLLAQAGYPGGVGLERFASAFELTYVAEKESVLGPIAVLVQSSMRQLGFPVTLNPVPLTQYGDRQLVKKDLPFALNDQEKPVIVDAGYAVSLFFVSPEAGGINNMVNYRNAEVDRLWARARNEIDPAVRTTLLADIQRRLLDDVVWLPVVEYRTQWAHAGRLTGLSWYPDNAPRFFDLALGAQ